MKQKALLICADKEKTELDGALRRGLAPWQAGLFPDQVKESAAIDGYRSDYSLLEAVSFRIWGDLTRSGLQGKDATDFVNYGLSALIAGYVSDRFEVPSRTLADLFTPKSDPIWIAREVSRSDMNRNQRTLDRRDFYVRCWAGSFNEIQACIANLNEEGLAYHRATVSVQFYNLSEAVQQTRAIAISLGVLDVDDTGSEV